jgi:hypothetical protein
MESPAPLASLLGEPRQGFHAARIPVLDVALWDTVGTIVIAVVVAYLFNLPVWLTVAAAFLLGIYAHWLFGVNTRLNVGLGLKMEDESRRGSLAV